MRVGFGIVRDVVIDDMRYLVYINSAGNDIRRYEDVKPAISKALHCPIASALGHVSLDCDGAQPSVLELAGQAVGSVLGASKDDRGEEGGVLEQVLEQSQFSCLLDGIERVFDGLGGLGVCQLGNQWVDEDLVCQLAEILWHRRGEQQVLPFFRQVGYDPPDIRQKSHVEHVISFIEDQRVNLSDLYLAALEQIKDSSRAADDNLRSFPERLNLGVGRDSSVDSDGPDSGSSCEGPDLFIDLDRQFPRRSEDQGAWSRSGFFQQTLEKGKPEGGCLSGSGLRESKDIAAGNYRGNGFRLDRTRFIVASFTECVQEGGVEVKYVEPSRV